MSTIAAISTPFGMGGIAVIRISGDEAFCITDRFFTCHKAKRLFELDANTAVFGKITDKNNNVVDHAVVTVFKGPNSFTGEDTVEISCHGGILITKKILKLAIENGAVLAGRGEFSKRAFINGKIDLVQAEGIIDLINSDSEKGAETAVFQLEGRLSEKINRLRDTLLNISVNLQAEIDFPDEGISELSVDEIRSMLKDASAQLKLLVDTADYGRIVKNGLPVAVIGKPNVGKSSLLNALSGQEKAIVTDIAGTTRDIVEEYVNIEGIAVKVMDTAGIRETEDKVELIGVERSIEAAKNAALILAVFDGSRVTDEEDEKILEFIKDRKHIKIINKCDLERKCTLEGIEISAKKYDGIEILMNEVANAVNEGAEGYSGEIITNERHIECLVNCRTYLENAVKSLDEMMPVDLISIDVQMAVEALGEITGMTVSQEIVDNIFKNFCVGK